MNNDNILEMKSITKTFPGVKALDNVNIYVKRGEIHFIVGENGAGTAYSPIDTLTIDNKQLTYDTLFASGYKSEDNETFSNIDFSVYK